MSYTYVIPRDRTGFEKITGETPDILHWLDFDFYNLIWYWGDPDSQDYPNLGRWIGIAYCIWSNRCYYILIENGHILSRTTGQHVPQVKMNTDDMRKKIEDFNSKDVHAVEESCMDGPDDYTPDMYDQL
eukprot:13548404-Ditylum_brightwellii.AAC.1